MPFAMSDYLESGLYNHIFRNATYSKPTTISIALCGNVPTESSTGANCGELANTGSYARIPNASGDAFWSHLVAGSGNNAATITFPTATSNWGYVSGVAICDSNTYGAGNMLMYGALTTPRLVLNGDTFTFSANNVSVSFD